MPDKKILITGGAGFIGSHLIEKLVDSTYKIIVIDNLSAGKISNFPDNNDIKLYKMDIEKDDIESIFKEEKPDYCIHLAAQTSVNAGMNNPYFDANVNILGSIKLISLCKKYSIKKFITASTAAVYGKPETLPVQETDRVEPISFYGLSKLTMEKYIQLFDIPYIIFRFSNVFGPRQDSSRESGVIAIFHEAMKKGLPINIYGDGEQLRDFVYVEDIANIIIKAIESEVCNEIINFSTNKGITVNELFDSMKDLYEYKLKPNYLPQRKGDIKNSILSNKKAQLIYGFEANTALKKGLERLKNAK